MLTFKKNMAAQITEETPPKPVSPYDMAHTQHTQCRKLPTKEKQQQQMKKKTSNKGEKEKKPKKILLLQEEEEKAVAANGKKEMVFDLPGQKRDPPEERDPLRIFYETLYQQLPHSELAAIWMMEYGLLPREVAETVHEKKQMKKNQSKLRSPTKVVATVKKTTKSVTVKKTPGSSAAKKKSASKTELRQSKKRKMGNSVSEEETDDFVLTKTKKKSKA